MIFVSLSFLFFFHDKGRLHNVEIVLFSINTFHSSSVCWSLLCLYLWCFIDLNFLFVYPYKSCDFSSFCVILLSSFFFLCLVNSTIITPIKTKKTETPLKQQSNSMNGLTKQTKILHLHKIQPTNQNPRAHLRKSSAIAPAPPTSW